jgi:O-antigen ligase
MPYFLGSLCFISIFAIFVFIKFEFIFFGLIFSAIIFGTIFIRRKSSWMLPLFPLWLGIAKRIFAYDPPLYLDPVVYFTGLSTLLALILNNKRITFRLPDYLLFLFCGMLAFGILYAPYKVSAILKFSRFFLTTFTFYIMGRLCFHTEKQFIKFAFSNFIFITLTALFALVTFANAERLSIGRENPVPYAAQLGFAIASSLPLAIAFFRTQYFWAYFSSFSIVLITLLMTGTRGAVIFTGLSFLLIYGRSINFQKAGKYLLLLCIVAIGIGIFSKITGIEPYRPFLSRLKGAQNTTINAEDIDLNNRDQVSELKGHNAVEMRKKRYQIALDHWKRNPFLGLGTGVGEALEGENTHNVILELLEENGAITIILLILAVIVCFRKFLLKKIHTPVGKAISVTTLFSFLVGMTSFSYANNKFFCLSFGILVAYAYNFINLPIYSRLKTRK